MKFRRTIRGALATLVLVVASSDVAAAAPASPASTLVLQNEQLFSEMARELGSTPEELAEVRAIFARSSRLGQGNPAITVHPLSSATCRERAAAEDGRGVTEQRFAAICGERFMAPLVDPSREEASQAKVCIDQYEFPNLPCAYPVVWVRAREAAELCAAVGKRLCDAHEWEGACAGSLQPPDYRFELAAGLAPSAAVSRMRAASNRVEGDRPAWAYGSEYRTGICAAASSKSDGCDGGDWQHCGSNTYPAGAFSECRSPLGVYDLHGNAAEHMNLPLAPDQMASRGSRELGVTEMKGSWFIFDRYRAHEDHCRWRAPYWHGSRVMDPASHRNYHLGFRCCKTLAPRATSSGDAESGTPATVP